MKRMYNEMVSTKLEMINLIAENFSDFFVDVSGIIESEVFKSYELKYVKNKDCFWPSGIFDIRLEDEVDRRIKDIILQMRLGKMPKIVMTDPLSKPSNYHELFEKHGLIKKSEVVGMAIRLSDLMMNNETVSNLKLMLLNDEKYLLEWSRIVCLWLFGMQESDVAKLYEIAKRLYSLERFQLFLALYKEKPVASSLLYLSNKAAGIYHVATIPEYRNKGIGKQITFETLLYARDRGYDIATLQASQLGEPIYKKIGFEEYCRLGRYRI